MELAGEEVVGAPPDEEEGAEDQGGEEAAIEATDAMGGQDFPRAIDRARVKPFGFLYGVLDL